MKKLLFSCLFLLAFANAAKAQVYCDTNPPTSGVGTVGVAEKVDACIAATDTGGNPVTPSSWNLYVNGVSQAIVMTRVNETATSGLIHYTGAYTPSVAGNQSLAITATGNGKESVKSTTFLLSVSNPPSALQAPVKFSTQ